MIPQDRQRRGSRRPFSARCLALAAGVALAFLGLAQPVAAQDPHGNDNPAGTEGAFNGNVSTGNSYDPYTRCAMRDIVDLVVPGAVGERGLSFVRHWRSRNDETGGLTVFGDGNWRHDYDWLAIYWAPEIPTPQFPRPRVFVQYPDGRAVTFAQPAGGGSDYLPITGGIRDTLQVGGSTALTLTLAGGSKVIFSALSSNPNYRDYRADSLVDRHGLVTALSYSGGLLSRITEPAGRYIDISYLGINLGGTVTTIIDHIQASNGQYVQYYYMNLESGSNLPVLGVAQYNSETNNTAPFIHSSYRYQVLSAGGAGAFLSRAYDPHAAGPMKTIGYAYDEDGTVAGELYAEAYADPNPLPYDANGNYLWTNVSIVQAPTASTRTELRADGATRTFTYGAGGRLTNSTDFYGHATGYQYDGNGYVNQVQDAENRVTTLVNNSSGRPTLITRAFDGVHRDFTYADGYFMLTAIDELTHKTTWTRHPTTRRVERVDYADGAYEEFTYNGYGQVLTHRLTNGTVITNTYDVPVQISGKLGLLTKQNGPDGNTFYTYDELDRVKEVINPRGKLTSFTYNGRHQVKVTTLPAVGGAPPSTVVRVYNNEGSVTKITDELGHDTTFSYDTYQRMTARVDPVGPGQTRTTQWSWHRRNIALAATAMPANAVCEIISHAGKKTVFDYDDNRRLRARFDGAFTPEETYVRWERNLVGQVTHEFQARPNTTPAERLIYERHYDGRGFMDWMDDAAGQRTHFTYDDKGNRKVIALPSTRTISYDLYDNRDRPTKITDERNKVTRMSYWPSGNLKDLTDPNLKVYQHQYDAANRKTKLIYPDNSFEEWVYAGPGASAGLLTTYRTRAGDLQNFTLYDERNRLKHSDWNGNVAPALDYTWDAAGRLTGVANPASAITNVYNDVGEQTEETQAISGIAPFTIKWQRNAEGLVEKLVSPSSNWHSLKYTYNARNQLEAVDLLDGSLDPRARLIDYAYRTDGLLESRTPYNQVRTGFTYDGAGRVETLHTYGMNQGNRTVAWRQHHYDAMSRLDWFKKGTNGSFNPMENGRGDEFFYDEAGQLWGTYYDGDTGIDGSANTAPATIRGTNYYGYDNAGNRLFSHNDSYTVDTANGTNRYTHIGGFGNVAYDGRGNLTNLGTSLTNCTYDALGRLTGATSGTFTLTFSYDPLGRCVRRTVLDTAQKFAVPVPTYRVHEGWNLIEERNASNALLYLFFNGVRPDEVIGRWDVINGYWLWFHYDRLGSVTHLTNDAGAIAEQYAYDAFGKVWIYDGAGAARAASAVDNRILFTGREWIPQLGIYDYRNRAYHPGIGRFLQPDPIRFDGGDTNLYRYCNNNPVSLTDPFGLAPKDGYPNWPNPFSPEQAGGSYGAPLSSQGQWTTFGGGLTNPGSYIGYPSEGGGSSSAQGSDPSIGHGGSGMGIPPNSTEGNLLENIRQPSIASLIATDLLGFVLGLVGDAFGFIRIPFVIPSYFYQAATNPAYTLGFAVQDSLGAISSAFVPKFGFFAGPGFGYLHSDWIPGFGSPLRYSPSDTYGYRHDIDYKIIRDIQRYGDPLLATPANVNNMLTTADRALIDGSNRGQVGPWENVYRAGITALFEFKIWLRGR